MIQRACGKDRFAKAARRFWTTSASICPSSRRSLPHDYDKMLRLIAQMEEKGDGQRAGADRSILRDEDTK